MEAVPKSFRGTDIILHLKEDEKDFLESWTLRRLVKQFSDFIEHPIVMDVEQENEKKEKEIVEETLNSRKALWLRSKSDVTTEEYNAFYQQISGDFTEPAKVIHYAGEGTMEFKVLLFIPAHKPFDMQFGEQKYGPKLYIRRVLIMDHCEQLLPPYLRFVRGVVDSSDLPLNVSRELLQQNPLLERIQRNLVKSVLKALEEMRTSSPESVRHLLQGTRRCPERRDRHRPCQPRAGGRPRAAGIDQHRIRERPPRCRSTCRRCQRIRTTSTI